jgi:hypothetical protein
MCTIQFNSHQFYIRHREGIYFYVFQNKRWFLISFYKREKSSYCALRIGSLNKTDQFRP